jgi:rod shape-determining protein MreD
MLVRGWLIILLTLFLALAIDLIPASSLPLRLRPDLVLLALIYWTMAIPQRIGIFSGLVIGLLVDVATGSVLGQHALSYSAILWAVVENHKRLRLAIFWKQTLIVMLLLLGERIISAIVLGATLGQLPDLLFWLAPLLALVVWPLVFGVLRAVRRTLRVE